MLGCWRVTSCLSGQLANRFCCGASGLQTHVNEVQNKKKKKKVVVVGSGWAGLGAAHHLSKQVRTYFSPYALRSTSGTPIPRQKFEALCCTICLSVKYVACPLHWFQSFGELDSF